MPSLIRLALMTSLLGGVATGCTMNPPDPDADVFGHDWTITIGSASVASTEPNGTAWDGDGSPPDPYAKVLYNGATIATTSTVSDSYTADFDDVMPSMMIDQGDQLRVDLYDADPLGAGDMILSCPGDNVDITAAELRQGGLQCSDTGSTLVVLFHMDD